VCFSIDRLGPLWRNHFVARLEDAQHPIDGRVRRKALRMGWRSLAPFFSSLSPLSLLDPTRIILSPPPPVQGGTFYLAAGYVTAIGSPVVDFVGIALSTLAGEFVAVGGTSINAGSKFLPFPFPPRTSLSLARLLKRSLLQRSRVN